MTNEIKAIETHHDGYRFRSRLEARWAVFFDALGIKYEYEKEGFDLGEDGWYLPDFFLPDYHVWVEIKGVDPTDEEGHKVNSLVMTGGFPAFLFVGLPRWGITKYEKECKCKLDKGEWKDGYKFDIPDHLIVDGCYFSMITKDEFIYIKDKYPEELDGIFVMAINDKTGKAVSCRDTKSFCWTPFVGIDTGRRQVDPFRFSTLDYRRALDQARGARFG